jgi:hypothetical protein
MITIYAIMHTDMAARYPADNFAITGSDHRCGTSPVDISHG